MNNNNVIGHIVSFFVLVFVQVLFLNNVFLSPLCNPYIYILFIVSLPIMMPRWADLLLGFCLGFMLDVFSDTLGMHTFATVLIVYLRQPLLRVFVNEEDKLIKAVNVYNLGFMVNLKYVSLITFIHHTVLFALEAFSMVFWWRTLLCIILSSLCSTLFMLVIQHIFYNGKR